MTSELVSTLLKENTTRIVLLVMDGLGGLPREPGGRTELESTRTPNLDRLAAEPVCGLHQPLANALRLEKFGA